MYIRRKYSLKAILNYTGGSIVFFLCIAIIPVVLYDVFEFKWLTLPWLPISLVGTALAFITGFKNNAAYDRAWEARQIYGSIVNSSRKLTVMMNDYITQQFVIEAVTEEELFKERIKIANYHFSWLTALRHNLRQPKLWETDMMRKTDLHTRRLFHVHGHSSTFEEDVKPYLSDEDYAYISTKSNIAAACMKLQSNYMQKLKLKGYIESFRHMKFQDVIGELIESQGRAERIKNFPYPRQFATMSHYLLWIFIILMPFGVMSEFERIGKAIVITEFSSGFVHFVHNHFVWMAIPFSIVISWIFYMLERVGDTTENPFVGLANDVPITTISRAIEIEMLELIGVDKVHIPKPIQPVSDISM